MTELAPGDVVEIETGKGLAYVQVTHRHCAYPEVVRALPGFHASRPANVPELARGETAFRAMISLSGALEQKRIAGRRIGSEPIPLAERAFPTFKMAVRDRQGNIAYWWFWDGEGLRYEERPGPESERLPLREVMTADTLLARLAAMEDDIDHR